MRFIFLILFLISASNSFGDAPMRSEAIDQALSVVEQTKDNVDALWLKQNVEEPYIALISDDNIVLNEDFSYREVYHSRVKVQKEEAQLLSEWPIYYNKSREEIVSIKAFVETPQGKRVDGGQIKDLAAYDQASLYKDLRVKVINFAGVSVGSVIDVTVVTDVKRKEIPNQFWTNVPYPFIPTKVSKYVVTAPDSLGIKFNGYNTSYQPVIDKDNGKTRFTFQFEKTQDIPEEEFMPPVEEVQGVLSLSSVADWKQVADFYRDQMNKNMSDDTDILAKSLDLTKGLTNQKDKAKVILEYIQDNIRYVSIPFGDHSADMVATHDVFHERHGNNKDICLLTKQMLKLVGIDANLVLFSGEFNGDPRNRLPSPSAFDHVILQVMIEGDKYYVDPQAKGFDFGQLPSDYDKAHAFIIEEASQRFDDLPVSLEETHTLETSSDIFVSENGGAVIELKVKMPLEASVDFREHWANSSQEEKDKFFLSLQSNFAQGGNILDKNIKGLSDRYGNIELYMKYEAPQAYGIVNDMILLKEDVQGDLPEFDAKNRRYPIFMPNNSVIKNRNVYHLGDGLRIDFIPQSYKLSMDFIEVNAVYVKKDDATISVDNIYRTKRAKLPRDRYADITNFRKQLHVKADQYIVLKKKTQIPAEAKDWIKKQ